jgi:hypothetical protein
VSAGGGSLPRLPPGLFQSWARGTNALSPFSRIPSLSGGFGSSRHSGDGINKGGATNPSETRYMRARVCLPTRDRFTCGEAVPGVLKPSDILTEGVGSCEVARSNPQGKLALKQPTYRPAPLAFVTGAGGFSFFIAKNRCYIVGYYTSFMV